MFISQKWEVTLNARNFYGLVDEHAELEWLGAKTNDEGVDCAYVRCTSTGTKHEVPLTEIAKHDWETWEAVLLSQRDAKIMKHITRIVGYYSQVDNWNRSKLAELDDRHKGNYGVPEQGAAPVVRELAIA